MACRIDGAEDLADLEKEIRRVITEEIKQTKLTKTGFAKKVKVHPAQILRYINGNKNLLIETLVNIGIMIRKFNKKNKKNDLH